MIDLLIPASGYMGALFWVSLGFFGGTAIQYAVMKGGE